MSDRAEREGWDARPWAMAALGAVAGLLIHFLTDGLGPGNTDPLRVAAAAFVAASATLLAFTLEPVRWRWAALFALGAGAVVGLVIYWNGSPASWEASEGWRSVCVALAVAIAAPLFQTARDEGAARFPYVAVHGHAWTNVVIWFAAWAFVGIVFALAFLLSALFELIGIDVLRDLLRDEWFDWTLAGTAFGGAIGLLRERDRIVGLLQRVVVSVLAVLAPLWEATKSTTPILLACVIGALILANAVIGNSEAEESRSAPLRYGAMALGLAMLPFALIAAISTGARIDQYGFTPDRLWALVFVIVATAYGLAYLVVLVRRRLDWAEAVRPANLTLAFGLCALALFLATPILSFNAISTRDQVARLESGRVSPDKFDWSALRFDFGEPGRKALDRLARSGLAEVKRHALAAQKLENRWEGAEVARVANAQERLRGRLRVLPEPVAIPDSLAQRLMDWDACAEADRCYLLWRAGADSAVVVRPNCASDDRCTPSVARLKRVGAEWPRAKPVVAATPPKLERADLETGPIEVREVTRRQVFVNGKAVGEPFE